MTTSSVSISSGREQMRVLRKGRSISSQIGPTRGAYLFASDRSTAQETRCPRQIAVRKAVAHSKLGPGAAIIFENNEGSGERNRFACSTIAEIASSDSSRCSVDFQ